MPWSLLPLLLLADTLPPLPDLSTGVFPEPPVWIAGSPTDIRLDVHAGDEYGLLVRMQTSDISVRLDYDNKHTFDRLSIADAEASGVVLDRRFYVQPSAQYTANSGSGSIKVLTPAATAGLLVPHAVIDSKVAADQWWIDGSPYREEMGDIEITMDDLPTILQFGLRYCHRPDGGLTRVNGQVHVRNMHLGLWADAGNTFPSPTFEIAYRTSDIAVQSRVASGVSTRSLREFLDFEQPRTLSAYPPEETLRAQISVHGAYIGHRYHLAVSTTYSSWQAHVTPAALRLVNTGPYDEIITDLGGGFTIQCRGLVLQPEIAAQHVWTDTPIVLLTPLRIIGQLRALYRSVAFTLAARYRDRRLRDPAGPYYLEPWYVVSPGIECIGRNVTVYGKVENLLDNRIMQFDNYPTPGRRFVAGISGAWSSP